MQFATVDFLLQLILTLILADIGLKLITKHLEILLRFDFHAIYKIWVNIFYFILFAANKIIEYYHLDIFFHVYVLEDSDCTTKHCDS